MSIWLIRHGETALNAARVLQPADTPLSPHGQRQAEALAERMQGGEGFAAILSSDLPRAAQTAQAIAHLSGHNIEYTALLHERNFGDWRGRPYDSLDVDPLAMHAAPPGGETATQFAQRCEQAFERILHIRRQLDAPLVVVTHGLVIRQVLSALPARSHPDQALPRMGNTSVTIVDAAPPHSVRLLNCTAHLYPGLLESAESLSGG